MNHDMDLGGIYKLIYALYWAVNLAATKSCKYYIVETCRSPNVVSTIESMC